MATIYISPSGNDTTGNGTSGNPYATISKAHTVATSGDSIVCKDGTYTWTSQSFTKSLTISAETNGAAIFDATGSDVAWILYNNCTVTLIGLRFQNADRTSGGDTDTFGINNSSASTWAFDRCVFKACRFARSFIRSGNFATTTIVLSGCVFDAVYNRNDLDYQALITTKTGIGTVTIINCVFYIPVWDTNTLSGFRHSSSGSVWTIKNCILYNTSGKQILFSSYIQGTETLTYSGSDAYLITSPPSGSGNITTEPKFVDPTNSDFHLAQDSPARGAGTSI